MKLSELVEFFILGDELCVGFYEKKIESLGISIYYFQKRLVSALEIFEKVENTDISIWKESLETIEKIQYGKNLDSWDESNLQYTIEDIVRTIIEHKESLLLERKESQDE